jgi:SPP1 family predicted phage head-tail adaptor
MRAGELNTKILIQSKTITRGADGSEIETWATTITTRSKKETKGSREFYSAQKINAEISALFVILYRSATITRDMRILEGTRVFEIILYNSLYLRVLYEEGENTLEIIKYGKT